MAELAWPADLGHGTFIGRFGFMDADSHDPDRAPDITSATGGTVTITPSIRSVRYTGAQGPMILAARPAKGVIDSEGYLCTATADGDAGDRGMVFPATDDTALNPTDWTYEVSIILDGQVRIGTFNVKLPAGATVDLSLAAPVPSSGGTAVVVDPTTAERAEAAAARAEAAADEAEGYAPSLAWADLTGKPATYPPAPHAHQIGDVDGLGARLAIVGAGRPDIPGTMIGSVASEVAAAPSGTTFVSTDGPQGAWQWQKRGTAWTVTGGTITPRDIPFIDGTILTTRPGISTTISRTGDRVTLSIVNVLAGSSGAFSQAQQPIPVGFRPAQEFNGLLTRGSAEQHARLLVQTSGNVIVASAGAINGACAATATWVTTDPWPTTLPAS